MKSSILTRIKETFNAFLNRDPTNNYGNYGLSSYYRPDRLKLSGGNERSMITSIFNRIALDVVSIEFKHVRLDENERFHEVINSDLNRCLNLEANIDQTGKMLIQDIVMSMLDEGSVAIVPVETSKNIYSNDEYDISNIRVGKIIQWFPKDVKIQLYNELSGKREEIIMPKKNVGIIENPLFSVINEPNSTMQRLIRKLNLLDVIDEQSGSGKLDLIIQLPYTIKTELRRAEAEKRKTELENQLVNSRYGVGYIDATERITQLNRPVENNLMKQIEYLTSMLYSQLGITQAILDGTANDETMLNYYHRTVEPICNAIVDELRRKFLSEKARDEKETIMYFKDPFKLVPVSKISEIADKFTRNEIMTSNEIRSIVGMKPSDNPEADELRNKNLSRPKVEDSSYEENESKEENIQNED